VTLLLPILTLWIPVDSFWTSLTPPFRNIKPYFHARNGRPCKEGAALAHSTSRLLSLDESFVFIVFHSKLNHLNEPIKPKSLVGKIASTDVSSVNVVVVEEHLGVEQPYAEDS
jgi:hypothetical protein